MQKFIRFEKEKPFSEVQKSFMERFANNFSNHFVGNPEEIKKGQQRSFYLYKNVSENVKVLPYFHDGECLISLCISCDTRYMESSIIPPKLKIIGLYLETPWTRGTSPGFYEFSNAIVKGLDFLKRAVLYLRAVFYNFGVLGRKGIPVLIMHNLKTFHERVFESDFYSLYFHLDFGYIIHSLLYKPIHQLGRLPIFLDKRIQSATFGQIQLRSKSFQK